MGASIRPELRTVRGPGPTFCELSRRRRIGSGLPCSRTSARRQARAAARAIRFRDRSARRRPHSPSVRDRGTDHDRQRVRDRGLDRPVAWRARTPPSCATPARPILNDVAISSGVAGPTARGARAALAAPAGVAGVARVSLTVSRPLASFASGSSPLPPVPSCESASASASQQHASIVASS
jgi:hypothetical protein